MPLFCIFMMVQVNNKRYKIMKGRKIYDKTSDYKMQCKRDT